MRPFTNSQLWPIIDKLGDMTSIPEVWSIHLISLQLVFKREGWKLGRAWFKDPPSLFMNAAFFIQLRLPFWIGIQIRPFTKRYFQTGLGWKGNGRLAFLFRFQTDESSAIGMDGPNVGQATYMNDGTR